MAPCYNVLQCQLKQPPLLQDTNDSQSIYCDLKDILLDSLFFFKQFLHNILRKQENIFPNPFGNLYPISLCQIKMSWPSLWSDNEELPRSVLSHLTCLKEYSQVQVIVACNAEYLHSVFTSQFFLDFKCLSLKVIYQNFIVYGFLVSYQARQSNDEDKFTCIKR